MGKLATILLTVRSLQSPLDLNFCPSNCRSVLAVIARLLGAIRPPKRTSMYSLLQSEAPLDRTGGWGWNLASYTQCRVLLTGFECNRYTLGRCGCRCRKNYQVRGIPPSRGLKKVFVRASLLFEANCQRALALIMELIASVCPKHSIVNISTSHSRASPRVCVNQDPQVFFSWDLLDQLPQLMYLV